MRKPTIDDLKLWHVVVAGQYLLLGILVVIGTVLDHFYGTNVDMVPIFLGGAFFVLVSLFAFVCSVVEKSLVGVLFVVAPFCVPILLGLFGL